jgi:hypothetical protein
MHLRAGSGVAVSFLYSTCKNKPSARRKVDVFHLTTAQASFQTFVLTYTTPADACRVRIAVVSSTPMDVDAIR